MQLTAAITHEGSLFLACCPEVEVTSRGESTDDALENPEEALALYVEDRSEPASFESPSVTAFQHAARARGSRH